MRGIPEIVYLHSSDRVAWRERILAAVREADGSCEEAARKLDVNLSTLYRWVSEDYHLRRAVKKRRPGPVPQKSDDV
jgi:transposase-like protein